MKYTGHDVRSYRFSSKMRGYDRLEVDAYLFKVADWLDQSVRKNEQLSLQCKDLFDQYNGLREEHANLQKILISVNELRDQATAKSGEIVEKAETDAEELINEAKFEAKKIRARAEQDTEKLREEIASLTEQRDKILADLYETFLSQIRTLEVEGVRMGVDLARLLEEESEDAPDEETENVIKLNQKAEGDAS
ncbi:MAG: DivIVA domain-containing protein [Nitrospinae bacterium]|nr:DivIVA domain-containing protein [Nitrospinota bacterium]